MKEAEGTLCTQKEDTVLELRWGDSYGWQLQGLVCENMIFVLLRELRWADAMH